MQVLKNRKGVKVKASIIRYDKETEIEVESLQSLIGIMKKEKEKLILSFEKGKLNIKIYDDKNNWQYVWRNVIVKKTNEVW